MKPCCGPLENSGRKGSMTSFLEKEGASRRVSVCRDPFIWVTSVLSKPRILLSFGEWMGLMVTSKI
jgi:hypothetical protein